MQVVSTFSLAAGGSDHCSDQSGVTWLGQLLPRGAVESVFWLREGLGEEENTATLNARASASGFWLNEVE